MPSERARILVVDDEEIVRDSLGAWLKEDGYAVATAPDGAAALQRVEAEPWSILLVDLKMPGIDGLQVLERAKRRAPELAVVVMTAFATVDTAVAAMRLGAYDYLVKPFDPEELSLMMARILAQRALVRENAILRQALAQEYRFRDLVAKGPAMQALFDLARTAARSGSAILIQGEPGSGRRTLARAVHQESPRAEGPFVAVSGAARTDGLLEAELLGREEGAHSGALSPHKGKLEAADGGTLYLDEVGDLGPKLQLDLLRVLEERRFLRLGGTAPVEVDVRVVAATHRDLGKAVQAGRFREDLYYRLNVIPIVLPPLRQRREDIPLLVDAFLERISVELKKPLEGVSAEAMSALLAHDWPGNVQELRSVLERGAVAGTGTILQLRDLGLLAPGEPSPRFGPLSSLGEVERRHVAAVLSHTGGNVSQSARILGIDRVTLYNKMKKWGLRRDGTGGEGA